MKDESVRKDLYPHKGPGAMDILQVRQLDMDPLVHEHEYLTA